jgi:hypothetical protein
MLTGRTFTIVFIAYHYRTNACCFISRCVAGTGPYSPVSWFYGICLAIEIVNRTNQHIVGNVVKVSAVFQPGTSHGNMVGGTFSFCFDQKPQSFEIRSFPNREWAK